MHCVAVLDCLLSLMVYRFVFTVASISYQYLDILTTVRTK